ncbi:hypothetical protein ACF07F_16585 [Streptomyces sp. NPDC015237]|uniref:hypothetical protein n=1 Tax=Streptomyces sp. NPDC015237 TaxID=3364949 RepID=UPI0036FF69DE
MSRHDDNAFTAFALTMGLVTLGIGAWIVIQPLRYLAPGLLAMLAGGFLIYLAFAARSRE